MYKKGDFGITYSGLLDKLPKMTERLAAPVLMTEKEHTLLETKIREDIKRKLGALEPLSTVSAFKWCESFDSLFKIFEHTKMTLFTEI